jgi:leader peptidase (prepilin peptidase)/N-methyltransferase
LGAALIGAVSLASAPGWEGVCGAVFGWMLLALALLDAEHFWLPDALTLPLLGLGLGASFLVPQPWLGDRLIGAAAGYAMLALIALAYAAVRRRKGLGGGDPKLLAAIGAWLGWQALPFVLLAASLGGLGWAGVSALRGKPMSGQDRLPLGTLMALAAWPIWLIGAA